MPLKMALGHCCPSAFALITYLAWILAADFVEAASQGTTEVKGEGCGPDLESKFLSWDGKCPYSGLVPVKGSCTEYIPCISFGGELLKPLKRAECPRSAGLGFDVESLRCRPMPDFDNCLQRVCYSRVPSKINQQEGSGFPSTNRTSENGEMVSSTTVPVSSPASADYTDDANEDNRNSSPSQPSQSNCTCTCTLCNETTHFSVSSSASNFFSSFLIGISICFIVHPYASFQFYAHG